MGISNDSAEELGSWLHDEDFPFVFASDADNDGATYAAFGGGLRDNNMVDSRAVIVIGPDRRIAGTIKASNHNDPLAYEALAAIEADKAAGKMPDRPLVEADFRRRRAMMLPEAARYNVLLEMLKDGNLGTALTAAMEAVEDHFPPLAGQLLKDYERFDHDLL